MKILLFTLLSFLMAAQQEPIEVVYEISTSSWYAEYHYLDEFGEEQIISVLGMPKGGLIKTVYMQPGPWSFAAVSITTAHGGVSCKLTIDGILVKKSRVIDKLDPLATCSGPVK